MGSGEHDTSEVDQVEPMDLDPIDFVPADQQFALLSYDPTMPALFENPTGEVDTRVWIQQTDRKIGLWVQHQSSPISTWDDVQGWVASASPQPPRGNEPTTSEPEELAYGILSLGWDVKVRIDNLRATVLAKPRFAKTGGITTRAWEALRVAPGSQILYVWGRQSPKGEWELDESKSSATGIDEARVLVDESDAFLLALTIAPDWLMPPELNAETHWHNAGALVAETELPADSYAPLPAPDAETVAKRKVALVEWMSDEEMDGPLSDRAAVRAFLASHSPVGHYVLAFRDGGCYVGETTNFNTRFAQHEKTYPGSIEAFYLRRDKVAAALPQGKQQKHRLLAVERQMIHHAQKIQLHPSNLREMANPAQPWTGFMDLLDGPKQLADWFIHPDTTNLKDPTPFKSLSANDFSGAKDKIQRYRTDPAAQQVNRIIEGYLRRCVPFPARTELESWAISCLPAAKRGGKGTYKWSVIACLSISRTEALTILREDWSQRPVGFIAVNEIDARLAGHGGLIRFLRRHPGVDLSPAIHHEFGPGTMNLYAASLDSLEQLLNDTTITRAASTSALRLCRLGPSTQRAVHNPFLVDDALRTRRIWL